MTRFTTIEDIINHIRGKFPHKVYVGKEYSKLDLIHDLEQIAEDAKIAYIERMEADEYRNE